MESLAGDFSEKAGIASHLKVMTLEATHCQLKWQRSVS